MNPLVSNPDPARVLLQIDVTAWSPDRVTALLATVNGPPAEQYVNELPDAESTEPSGWTHDALLAAIAGLRNARAYAQVQVIEEAARRGGQIDREQVYSVAGYPAGRSLRGFTRATNRVVAKLQDEGLLPEDAEDLLETVYDPNGSGYRRALGFRIPADVALMLRS